MKGKKVIICVWVAIVALHLFGENLIDVVNEADYEDGYYAEQEELRLRCHVQTEDAVGQHKREEYVHASDVGYFACVRGAFVGAHHQMTLSCKMQHERHCAQSEAECRQTDEPYMLCKIFCHFSSCCRHCPV